MKKLSLSIFFIFLILTMFHQVAYAKESFVQTVEEADIFKKEKDTYVKVGTIHAGEQIEVTASQDDTYYEVQVGEETCYIQKTSVKDIETPDRSLFAKKENKFRFLMYTTNEATLYYKNGSERKTLGTVSKGMPFSMIADEGDMYIVMIAGRFAFIDKENVQFIFPSQQSAFEITIEKLPVYTNKNGMWKKVGILTKGVVLYRQQESEGKWHKIEWGQTSAYVPKTGTKPLETNIQPVSPYPSTHFIVTKEKTVVYSEAAEKKPMMQVDIKYVWPVKGTANNMYKIAVAGKIGYVPKRFVTDTIDSRGVVNPNQTYTYEQLMKDLNRLQTFYPDLIQVQIIGKSVEGRNIYAIKLGKGSKEIFMNASHHAREHITTNVLMEMLDTYAFAYNNFSKVDKYDARSILNRTSIWFVPMVNPDGVTLVQKGPKAVKNGKLVLAINKGKRNFSAWKANIRGVDLNRQYNANWKDISKKVKKTDYKNYKGPKPFSEPEVQALRQFTLAHKFEITISYHSSGEIIYWYFQQPKKYISRDQRLASMIAKQTGYSLVKPKKNPGGGGYKDWFISTFQKPGFTIEVAPYVGEKPVPLKLFPSIWKKNYTIGLMMANEVK
ncbi:MAG: M14 family metallocarboxypeptidase [Anoxybacillus sp.]|nr:M14 family metallocarboxypeptidase [Anoxybacillus sp.]MCL6585021.1 M14 family metallocarboxypeptidase [Anoxybacillus sp.]